MAKELRLGGHLKADEGLSFVVATARGMCYNEIQIMTGNGREYTPWDITEATALQFKKMSYEMTTTVHFPYVINPCESSPQRRGFYKRAFKAHVAAAEALGARRLVLHPGFKKELTEVQAFRNLLKFIEEAWNEENRAELLLETDSGSKNGSAIGSPDFIAEAVRAMENPSVRMCVDTTHLYARGINLWDKETRTEFLKEHNSSIGLVHLNVPDKEVGLGSFLDRHNTAFEDRKDLNHPPFLEDMAHFPMILERRSLQVQQRDNLYVRRTLGQPLEKQRA